MLTKAVPQFAPLGVAAVAAGVSEPRVRYWIRLGLLPTRTLGRRQRPVLVEVALVQQLAAERPALDTVYSEPTTHHQNRS